MKITIYILFFRNIISHGYIQKEIILIETGSRPSNFIYKHFFFNFISYRLFNYRLHSIAERLKAFERLMKFSKTIRNKDLDVPETISLKIKQKETSTVINYLKTETVENSIFIPPKQILIYKYFSKICGFQSIKIKILMDFIVNQRVCCWYFMKLTVLKYLLCL